MGCRGEHIKKGFIMELMQNVAKMQASQVAQVEQNAAAQNTQSAQSANVQAQLQQEQSAQESGAPKKIESQKDLEELVDQLNRSINPFNTSIRFGFDNRSDDFYVSVIEVDTNKLIRRYPAEKAQEMLPKIHDVSGLLFDSKG